MNYRQSNVRSLIGWIEPRFQRQAWMPDIHGALWKVERDRVTRKIVQTYGVGFTLVNTTSVNHSKSTETVEVILDSGTPLAVFAKAIRGTQVFRHRLISIQEANCAA
ncbi:hypothetical protein SDC9_193061 [bioreactor metagenome]|uniref:Uncharacterized protein n=1 Tax=bioreactor metagenome TaxID=1076179 RepID=A0A645IAZ5_9ZZZZ